MKPRNSPYSRKFEKINDPGFLRQLSGETRDRERAFKELVEVTHEPLTYFIRRFVRSHDEAQEVLQEVFLGVHKGVSRFKGKSKLTTWMYGIAHNKICDRLSDSSWQHQEYADYKDTQADSQSNQAISKSTPWELAPDSWFAVNTVRAKIEHVVPKLSDNLKQVYVLRDLQGFSGADTAGILNITEEAVRVRLHRARQRIVEMVQESLKADGARGAPA